MLFQFLKSDSKKYEKMTFWHNITKWGNVYYKERQFLQIEAKFGKIVTRWGN